MKNLALTLVLLAGAPAAAAAQCFVDIGLTYADPTTLEVRIRPTENFDTLFSSLVFTIRWDSASAANLGSIAQDPIVLDYMNVNKSGGEHDSAGYRYQVFYGESTTWISDAGASWVAAQEFVLMTIPITAGSTFAIVNDAWTGDLANNGDFYVSLNGQDRTGVIYSISTGVHDGSGTIVDLVVQPDPTTGPVEVTFAQAGTADLRLRVVNSLGQQVWSMERKGFQGPLRETIDLGRYGKGLYLLTLDAGGSSFTRRIVVQ